MKSVLIFLSIVSLAYGYNILCIQNVPSRSHYQLMKGIVYPLLDAGHKVTWITVYPDTKPVKNLKYVDVSHIKEFNKYLDHMAKNTEQGLQVVKQFAWNISRAALETEAVKDVVVNHQFDAVITEWFFSDVEAGYAAVQQVPWIFLSGMVLQTHMEYLVDQVRTVPTIPAMIYNYPIPMSFTQRIMNTLAHLFMTYLTVTEHSEIQANYETYFGPLARARGVKLPPYSEALHNISILLVNSHASFMPAQSLPPNVVEIAGYHIDENVPPLPKDLQDIMDSSTQGVIYFSMGSVLKSAELPEQTKRDLIKVFAELPYTVLWKFEEKMDNIPKNIHIRPWFPQFSILSHPNLKVFITHGGLLSTLESLHFGVPMLAVPVFGDQPSNALRSVKAGHALMVEYSPDMAVKLKVSLTEMLTNNSFYNRAKAISKLFRNRPVSNVKLIQHSVLLAIESKGAYHLRSKSLQYSWYQLWMLDQAALLLLLMYIIVRIIRKISSLFRKKYTIDDKKKMR